MGHGQCAPKKGKCGHRDGCREKPVREEASAETSLACRWVRGTLLLGSPWSMLHLQSSPPACTDSRTHFPTGRPLS